MAPDRMSAKIKNAVLNERVRCLENSLNERAISQKLALDAALLEKEKSVNAAFAASEKAIAKSEASQADYNKTIVEMQKDIVSLKESRSQAGGKDQQTGHIWGYIVGAGGLLGAIASLIWRLRS
jgi:hypothetical protein